MWAYISRAYILVLKVCNISRAVAVSPGGPGGESVSRERKPRGAHAGEFGHKKWIFRALKHAKIGNFVIEN